MAKWSKEFRDFLGSIISFPQDFLGVFGLPPSESGAIVNEMSALQIAAYFACVRVISDAVGTLPLRVYEKLPDGGSKVAAEHRWYDLFHVSPNNEMGSADLRQAGQSHILMTGNCYIEIDWSKGGDILGLHLRSPFSTVPYRRANGDLIYKTHDNPNGQERIVEASEMIHVKGMGIDGLVGLSPIKYYAREVLGVDLAAQGYSAKFFANGAAPGGVLSFPNMLTDQQKLDATRTWLDAHGRGNNHKIALLEGGAKWEQTSVNPEEAMLIQTREMSRAMICAIFGVPEHMAGGKEETRASVEQKSLEFLMYTLKTWLKKWEQAINMKVFPRLGRTAGKYFVKFDTTELERADYATMVKGLQMARYAGLVTVDEGRKMLGLNPYEETQLKSKNPADKLWMPVNMQPVTEDMEPKPAAPASGGIGGNQSPAPGEENKSLSKPFLTHYPLFRDAFGRIMARKKANEDDFQRTFQPVFVSMAATFDFPIDAEPGDMALNADKVRFVKDYISAMSLRSKTWTLEQADKQAADELKRALKFVQEKCSEREETPDE